MNWRGIVLLAFASALWTGCYSTRKSSGGGQTEFSGVREVEANDVALPDSYRIEAIARDLTFPTGAAFDQEGRLHIVESGYCYGEVWTTPRLLRVEPNGTIVQVAAGDKNGPWTGVDWHDGAFYVAEGGVLEGGRILRISPDGKMEAIVEGLPSYGDHHTDGPAVGPDGWIYFGQGTASNSGVIGEDNFKFGWLKRHPKFHDIPGGGITLVGQNFESPDVLDLAEGRTVKTGAFSPFGTPARAGQTVPGQVKCSGAILRVRPDGSQLELVAWGLRNPFGLAFSPEGQLYVTDNAYDERGSRPIWGAADVLWRIQPGSWYGWPDFSAGEPVNQKKFKAPRKPQPEFLLAEHPGKPPQPVAKFAVHSSADGFSISKSEQFGHVGQAFIALFGDEAPGVGKTLHPPGFKVVRVDLSDGRIEDFAVNKGPKNAPASKLKRGGLERPVSARFSPSGDALYVTDFGVVLHDKQGAKPQKRTGVIWKITRVNGGK